jgi:hypothetical protein
VILDSPGWFSPELCLRNAIDAWASTETVTETAPGVLPSHRKLGLARALMSTAVNANPTGQPP